MKFAIFGTGGVGGYFGGRLAQAGQDVTFIARGAHLAAIQESGLRVESINGDFTIHPATATDSPQSSVQWTWSSLPRKAFISNPPSSK
jgi:2-dehydropantoate 2-reductase